MKKWMIAVLFMMVSASAFADHFYGKKLVCEGSYKGLMGAVSALDDRLTWSDYSNKNVSAPSIIEIQGSNNNYGYACVTVSDK